MLAMDSGCLPDKMTKKWPFVSRNLLISDMRKTPWLSDLLFIGK